MPDGEFPAPAPDAPSLADAAASWRSAYVHIPFCRRRCPYCDFAVVAEGESPAGVTVDGYVDAVCTEIGMEPRWDTLDAVNFGGGTPTTLDPSLVSRVIDALRHRFGIAAGAEVSVEANPEDVTSGLVTGLVAAGVTRVSLGVQSFDDAVLRALGRRHDAAAACAAVRTVRAGGVASVSLDLIYGTPGESQESWRTTVDSALELDPDHLSAYALTVERGTELSRRIARGAPAPDPDAQAEAHELLVDAISGSRLVHYELSNFAAPGHPCRYNLATWAQGDYVGFGLGAHGHRDGVRTRNVRRIDRYLQQVAEGKRPESGFEGLDVWGREQERLMLGLRRCAGVVPGEGGTALLASGRGRRLVEAGVLSSRGGRLFIDRPMLADEVNRAILDLGGC
jgi:putative oxygen-independent coproporphyrinogen III oxidase